MKPIFQGQTFGKLTTERPLGKGWECKCDCGKSVILDRYKLTRTSESTKSCGCLHKHNLKGRVFGRLTVMKECPTKYKDRTIRWVCVCSCGKTSIVTSTALMSTCRGTKSCGCLKLNHHKSRKHPFEAVYNYLVRSSKRRNIPINISYEEFVSLTTAQECHYCGAPVIWRPYREKRFGNKSPSNLDRKNNKLGYSLDNVVICCWDCNRGKGSQFSYKRWRYMTASIRELRKEVEDTNMKIKKTNVFRLEVEKDSCACKISGEYSDAKYTTPLKEYVFYACEKHAANPEVAEFAKDMMIECLATEAINAGKQYAPLRQNVAEGDSGGVQAEGESVQAMGANMPNRQLQNGPRRDPTEIRQMQVDRPVPRGHTAGTGSLNTALPEGIEFSEEIGVEAEEDPNLSAFLRQTMDGIGDMLDQDDAKLQGVPQRYLKDEE